MGYSLRSKIFDVLAMNMGIHVSIIIAKKSDILGRREYVRFRKEEQDPASERSCRRGRWENKLKWRVWRNGAGNTREKLSFSFEMKKRST